jgi:transcriptional regulator with GAF, ATPase, and Fis domain
VADDRTHLEQRLRELEELNRLAQSLGSTLRVEDTLNAIADACLKLCGADRVALLLIDPSEGEPAQTIVRKADIARGEIDHTLNLLVVEALLRRQQPLLTENIVRALGLRNPSDNILALGPALAVPLVVEKRLIGVINMVNSRDGKPFTEDSLRVASLIATLAAQFIERARLHETLFEDHQRLKKSLQQQFDIGSILGESPATKELLQQLAIVAMSNATVLLIGETGTGKELAARALHYHSRRSDKSFVAINCAAIPTDLFESELFGHERGAFTGATSMVKGKFELAHQGTLFLDEISAMPLELQPKLLRVLEERKFHRVGGSVDIQVDVRVIAASSKDLNQAVRKGEFRDDLYHRLNVVPIYLPALRERRGDIPLLAQTFLQQFSNGAKTFAPDALDLLSRLEWRGNIRELRNTVERIAIFLPGPTISSSQIRSLGVGSEAPTGPMLRTAFLDLIRSYTATDDLLDVSEKELIQTALREAHGNISQAARLLHVDRSALQRRVEKYGL